MSEEIKHYGTPRHSGRYPWGSGKNPQRHQTLIARADELKKQGLSEAEIAKALGFRSTTESRAAIRIAKNEIKKEEYKKVRELHDKGMGATAIAKELGLANESTVRSILKKKLAVEGDLTTAAADLLKDNLKKYKYIDIGEGVENNILRDEGITKERFRTAVAMLEQEGYVKQVVQIDQFGTKAGQKTYLTVLGPEGTTYSDVNQNKDQINSTWFLENHTEDGGYTFRKTEPPRSVDSKRIFIRYGNEGGSDKDGVIEIRPGVEDVNLGLAKYAQVRIAVDDKYYLKGMAVNSKDIPEGYDILVNSNKPAGTPNEKVFKKMNIKDGELDLDNPFGALTKQEEKLKMVQKHYIDKDGKEQLNCVNVVNEQGDWGEWKKKISSQFLSKQLPETAKKQLDLSYAEKQQEFEEIKSLTNPIVKKAMLQEFADNADASAVSLKATGFSGQRSYVILPVNSLKDNEVYAPNYSNGEQVVLVRFPHAGRFEIPLLKVNNNNKEAKDMLGASSDAIGINKNVANQLSGADFDGDTVVAIPIKNVNIKTEKVIKELREFEPKSTYAIPDDKKFTEEQEKAWTKDKQAALKEYPELKDKIPRMTSREKGRQMGEVSNLITDMTLRGAPQEDIIKAVKHSMTVIDAEKHYLDWKQSEIDNDIKALKERYQKKDNGKYGGASTLISQAKSEYRTEEVKEITTLTPKNRAKLTEQQIKDFEEGKRVYVKTGKTHSVPDKKAGVDEETGKPKGWKQELNMTVGTKMQFTDDAFSLSSGTKMEAIYARYANKLKGIANESRKLLRSIKPYRQDKEAAKEYREEVASLNKKLNDAQKNRPLERAAQNYANNKWKTIQESNREMDKSEIKKQKNRLLEEGRRKMGAKKATIKITDREWEAIQKRAVSSNQLEKIIANADKDRLKELALPRESSSLSSSKLNIAKAKINAGYTQSEVAEDLGISVSTLNKALNE